MKALLLIGALAVTGCSTISNTSFYDDNESKAVVDVWVSVQNLDCSSELAPLQVDDIVQSKQWLKTYSTGKGSKDVLEMVSIFEKSLDGLSGRVFGETYCNLKRKTLINQSEKMTKAMMGRF